MDDYDDCNTPRTPVLKSTSFDINTSSTCSSHSSVDVNSASSLDLSFMVEHVDEDNESYHSPPAPTFSKITDISYQQASINEAEVMKQVDEQIDSSVSVMVGYKVVGDNIDKNVKPRYARQENKTLSMHYYHSYAVRDRIDISSISDEVPNLRNTPLLSIPVTI